jgi:hypothetical protein
MATTKRPISVPVKNGIGVDSQGNPTVDPSPNVKDLSDASNLRQDDLRVATEKLFDSQIHALEHISDIRAEHRKEIDSLRDSYEEKLRTAEAKRIDAIRAVDVNAVAVDRLRASDQASVLANQVSASADTLRTLVSSTATAVQTAQTTLGNALSDRITKVEQFQYTGAGKGLGAGQIGAAIVGAAIIIGVVLTYTSNRAPMPVTPTTAPSITINIPPEAFHAPAPPSTITTSKGP